MLNFERFSIFHTFVCVGFENLYFSFKHFISKYISSKLVIQVDEVMLVILTRMFVTWVSKMTILEISGNRFLEHLGSILSVPGGSGQRFGV